MEKLDHFCFVRSEEAAICSVAESHVRPTSCDDAKRLAPTPMAREAREPDSCVARAATEELRKQMQMLPSLYPKMKMAAEKLSEEAKKLSEEAKKLNLSKYIEEVAIGVSEAKLKKHMKIRFISIKSF